MKIQKMNWAGLLVQSENTCIMIDPLYHVNTSFFGVPSESFKLFSEYGKVDAILITHLHSDHFDYKGILKSFGDEILLYVPEGTEEQVKEKGFKNIKSLRLNQYDSIGDFRVSPTYAVDGLGDIQVSWVVKDQHHSLIHCGDTLWHGHFWEIERIHGSFDLAALPINAAIVAEEGMTYSGQPICLLPEQAVSAATVLKSKFILPIHFEEFSNPPIYMPTEKPLERLKNALENKEIELCQLKSSEWFPL